MPTPNEPDKVMAKLTPEQIAATLPNGEVIRQDETAAIIQYLPDVPGVKSGFIVIMKQNPRSEALVLDVMKNYDMTRAEAEQAITDFGG